MVIIMKKRALYVVFVLLLVSIMTVACATENTPDVTVPVLAESEAGLAAITPEPDPCADCSACDCGDEDCCVPEDCSDCEMLGTYWLTNNHLRAERLSFSPAQRQIFEEMCAECQELFHYKVDELRDYFHGAIDRRINSIAEEQGLSTEEAIVYWENLVAETWESLVKWYNQKMIDEGFHCASLPIPGRAPSGTVMWLSIENWAHRELAVDLRYEGWGGRGYTAFRSEAHVILSTMESYSELIREIIDSTNWSYTAFYDKLEEIIGYEIPNFLGFQR
ncbi:MAG: hypothetical protein FWB92_13495 [Oscillospiraceae bacterium]|nr:hypothetical protein [Oscillospiraceae bacterium]